MIKLILIFLSLLFIIGCDKKESYTLSFNTYSRDGYVKVGELEKECWVKALRFLDLFKKYPDFIEGAQLVYGVSGYPPIGHAWIKYKLKNDNKWIIFDPTYMIELEEKD